jgi:hypothetical protein
VADLLTLDEAKTALRLQDDNSERDDLVQEYVDAVTSVVEARVGWIVPREITVQIRESGYEVALPGQNVISLTSGAYDDGGAVIDVTGMAVGVGGVLRRTNRGRLPKLPWTLTLQVGMNPIPGAIKRGAAEILIEAWKSQRGKPGEVPDTNAFLIPYRAAAWFTGFEQYGGFA